MIEQYILFVYGFKDILIVKRWKYFGTESREYEM